MNPLPSGPAPSRAQGRASRPSDPLALARSMDRIAVCEPRLALSASAAADVLLEVFAADPFGLQAAPTSSNAPAAASSQPLSALDGAGQSVAVIDSGIAWDHLAFARSGDPALAQPAVQSSNGEPHMGSGNRVVAGWDFAENDSDPYDDGPAGFHGTHVAGTLAGLATGFAGVAPGADLVALRVFDDAGRSSLDWIESALRWVVDHRTALEHPITTVNLSLGAFAADPDQPLTQLDDELQRLHHEGVVVVAAAGNSFAPTQPDALAYPASHPLVAAVTSIDSRGELQEFAQRADGVFAMSGAAIRSSVPDHVLGADGSVSDFAEISGTSMAAPQFAGATMLVRQAMQSMGLNPTVDDILSQLREHAANRTDQVTGATYHEVDLDHAISALLTDNAQAAAPATAAISPLQWDGNSSLIIQATSDSDEIILDLSGVSSVSVNSVVYPIERPFETLHIEGGIGNDTLRIQGGLGDERLIARAALPGEQDAVASLQRLGLEAVFSGFENVMLTGGGGNDRATFFDSTGNDNFEASPSSASLRGVGYTFVATDVNNVYAHATHGGSDTAHLYDSPGDDRLAIRHQFTSLRNDSQFRLAYGFEKVNAFAGSGGQDHADLYDSPGDDRFAASSSFASISSRDYYAGARGFATIRGEASAGGADYATLYAVDTTALWTRSADLLQWNRPSGEARTSQGFEIAEAYVAGERVEILPQSLRQAFHEQERQLTRRLFASLDPLDLADEVGG